LGIPEQMPKSSAHLSTLSEGAMPNSSIPAGYHTITPSIIVRDAAAAIDFYKRALGAEEIDRMVGPNGAIMHAEIRIGDSRVMLGEENEQWGTRSPLSTNGNPGSLHIYVENADAAFQRALEAGAKVRMPLEDAFWGDRYGKFTDPFGHEWSVATRVKEMTRDEMEKAGQEWMAKMAQAAGAPG
jgi:PhnB protein